MANRGSGSKKALTPAQVDDLFEVFYNRGQRRTLVEVEAYTKAEGIPTEGGVSYATIRRYADEFDWLERADAIDAETRKIQDAKLAAQVAEQRIRHINLASMVTTRLLRRFVPSTAEKPNPFEIQPDEISLRDGAEYVRLFELLTGGATERHGAEQDAPSRMEEMAAQIARMDARETVAVTGKDKPALTAGDGR
jgi:hypothetical protein